MRDSLFGLSIFSADQSEQANSTAPLLPISLQFILGLLMLIAGMWFFAGFLLRRDRKNGRVQERFIQKKRTLTIMRQGRFAFRLKI